MLPESSQCSTETAAEKPALFDITRNTQIGRQQADRDHSQKVHTVRRHKKFQIGRQQADRNRSETARTLRRHKRHKIGKQQYDRYTRRYHGGSCTPNIP